MKNSIVIITSALILFCTPLYGYQKNIHTNATGEAITASYFNVFLTDYLNFESTTKFSSGIFEQKTAKAWIESGGVKEDNIPRFLNHFFDPTTEKGITFLFQQNSSREWAKDLIANDWDWASGRGYFYEALTSTDAYNRETKFAATFRSVGQVMHLIEDLASPAHVRNDVHVPFLPWDKDFYEDFTELNNLDNSIIPYSGYPPVDISVFSNFDTFWKNNGKGLSEFTNGNFLSRDTNLDTNTYSSPTAIGEWIAEETPAPNKPPVKVKYVQGYVTDSYRPETSAPINKLASLSYFDFEMKKRYSPDKWVYTLNDSVHREYAQFLVPRAVGYAAGILNYFFRGKINLTVAPGDITFRSIKVTAQNDNSNETMAFGDVSLVIRYKSMTETSLGGGKFLLNNPSSDYTYKVVTLPSKVDMSTSQVLNFDFSSNPLPMNFSEMTMQLVYRGKLGYEDNAVAVSKLEPINGIYTDFALSLPPSGVYAKTSDSTTNASFNELRVTALSNALGGLSGGTISLALEYRTAIGDQFQSVLVDTEPANAAGYVSRTLAKNGVNTLPQGVPVELVFDLPQLPVEATDVEINVVYSKADGTTQAIGVRNISEPTPVDVYNNTDYTCLNSTWYRYDDPAAMAIVDSNADGIADRSDIYPHTISNIAFLSGSEGSTLNASPQQNNLFAADPLPTGQMLRLGYILSDYTNRFAISETRTGQNGDPWSHPTNNRNYPGTGFRNDGNTWSSMYNFRGKKMWWGEGVIFVNQEYNGSCTFDALNQKLGL